MVTVIRGKTSFRSTTSITSGVVTPTVQPTLVLGDEDFEYTTLLLKTNGVDTSNNNTFVDSSTNNFTITRNGNTTQGSYSPYRSEWSNYFDGTGDYLSYPTTTTASKLEGADFTFECWVYVTDLSSVRTLYSARSANDRSGPLFRLETTGHIDLAIPSSSGTWGVRTATGNPVSLNQWSHIAITREGTNLRVFIDGVLSYTVTINFSIHWPSLVARIGGDAGLTGLDMSGFLADLRMVKGTALYTANFTPPTQPLTAVTGTILLTCQSNRFIDNSSNDFAITRVNAPAITPFSPYIPSANYDPTTDGGSGYFDGTGDYLTVADDAAFDLSGDFTVEGWFYSTDTGQGEILTYGDGQNDTTGFLIYKRSTVGNTIRVLGGNIDLSTVNTISDFEWNHFALVRSGSTVSIYLNGVFEASTSNTTSFSGTVNRAVSIAAQLIGASLSNSFNGYISDFRIVKGTALYTSNFTPPTAPLTAVTNTSLLCNFTNAGIYDATGKNVVETLSGVQVDTTTVKYGTGSLQFDGTNDWIYIEPSDTLNITGESFTMETWIYPNDVSGDQQLITQDLGNGDGQTFQFRLDGSNLDFIYWTSSARSSAVTVTAASSVVANQWQHVAVSWDGTTLRLFVDGQVVQSSAVSSMYSNQVATGIGQFNATTYPNYFNGFMEDVRITKGAARYTENFTPPAAELPAPYVEVSGEAEPQLTTDGLVIYYDFADTNSYPGTGTVLTDLTATGVDINLSGGAFDAVEGGGSYRFDGNDSGLSALDNAPNLTTFTVESWYRIPADTSTSYHVIFQKEGGFSGGAVYGIRNSKGTGVGVPRIMMTGPSNSSSDQTNLSATTSNANSTNFYHVVGTYDGTNLSVYVNGVLEVSQPPEDGPPRQVDSILKIGEGDGRYANMYFAIGRVYDRALSLTEINNNFNAEKSRFGY